jgi:uncharacterized membrane protein
MTQPAVVPVVERVPIEHALSAGWSGTKQKFLLMVGVMLVAGIFAGVQTLAFYFGADMIQRHLLLIILLSIYQLVVSAVVSLGLIKLALHVQRQQPFTADDFLSVGAQLPSYCGAYILRAIILGIGYLFFIIPGIILHIKLDQTDYFIVDRKMGPVAALEASWRVTNGAVLMLWVFGLLTSLIQIIGWFLLLIGALPAHMIVIVSKAYVYDHLVETTQDATLLGKLAFASPSVLTPPLEVPAPEPSIVVTSTEAVPAPEPSIVVTSPEAMPASESSIVVTSPEALPAPESSIVVTPPVESNLDQPASEISPALPPNLAKES